MSAAAILLSGPVLASTYYWDTDGVTPGFGTANGTWGTDPLWTTNSTGGSPHSGITTTSSSDLLHFGTAATGLGSGIITVGSVSAKTLTFGAASGTLNTSGGTITLADVATLTVNNSSVNISSILAGAATSLTKAGAGTLALGGTNTYTGATTINGGKIQLALANPVTIPNSGFETPVTGTYAYNPTGGSWTFNGGSGVARNTFFVNAPPEGVQAGFLQSDNAGISQVINVGADGTYQITFRAQGRGGASGPLGIILKVDDVPVGTWAHTAISQALWLDYSAQVTLAAGSHTLMFQGYNTLGGDKASSIDHVQMFQPVYGSLPPATAVTLAASGTTLDLNGRAQTLGSLAGAAGSSVANGNLTLGGDNTSTTFAGSISGAGSLVKVGTGTFTLSGANTYTGGTLLEAGTLALGAGNALPASQNVILAGGTLEAGSLNNSPGTLTITNAPSIVLGSGKLSFAASAGATWSGTLAITGETAMRFGTDANALTTQQLLRITLNGNPVILNSEGYLLSDPVFTPPIILTSTPVDNGMYCSLTNNLSVTFSEPVAFGTGAITLWKGKDNSVVESFDVGNPPAGLTLNNVTVTLNPINDLEAETPYYVTIDATAIKDLADQPFAGITNRTTWNFITVPPLLSVVFRDDFDAAKSTSLTDPSARATGSLAGAVQYVWSSTTDVAVNGMLTWDADNSRDTSHQQAANGTQNVRMNLDWAPYLPGRIWEVAFDQRVAWSHPLHFGLSDTVQPGTWQSWHNANYDFGTGSYGMSLMYDTDNDNPDFNTGNALGGVFPAPPSLQDTHSFRIRFDEPAKTVTVWVNNILRAQLNTLDFESAGRYISFGEPTDYAGALDNLTVSVADYLPTWTSEPVVKAYALAGRIYSGTLSDVVSDVDPGTTLVFVKVSGPAWLSVAANGTLSGTPSDDDAGVNSFTVTAGDGLAAPVTGTVQIDVRPRGTALLFR